MGKNKNLSRVEVKGLEALFYDQLLLLGTAGLYQPLLKRVIMNMNIQPQDKILDMGAGTGKNACLMRSYLSDNGEIIGLDIGEIMIKKFTRKCGKFENVNILKHSIKDPIPFNDYFTKVFISFVIHGFDQNGREKIIHNAYNVLKQGGKLFIFDWAEFDLDKSGPFIKFFMRHIECPLAIDFIKRDFKDTLKRVGFKNNREIHFAGNKIRLLIGEK